MDQTNYLSDTISKSSSLLSGLLSQMNSAMGGDSAQDDLFSNLLSQSDALQTALAAQAQTTPAVTATPQANTTTNVNSSTDVSTTTDVSTQDSSSDDSVLAQRFNDISKTIRKILNNLPHKNQSVASNAPKQQQTTSTSSSQSSSPTTRPDTTGQNATQTNAQSAANSTTTSSSSTSQMQLPIAKTTLVEASDNTSSSDTTQDSQSSKTAVQQTLSDIMVELLAMIQLALQNLQKTKLEGGTATSASTQVASTTATIPSQDALSMADLNVVAGAGTDSNEITPVTPAEEAAADVSMTQSLLELIKTLQKDAQGLLTSDTATSTASAASATITASSASAALTTTLDSQFATLELNLKQSLATLRQQMQPLTSAKNNLAAVADADTQTSTSALTTNTPAEDILPKSSDSTTPTTQFFASAAAAQPQAGTGTSSAIDPSTNATSIVGAFDNRESLIANSDTNSDFQSDKGHTFASANDASSQGSGMTAEGLTATGTYSFASTLSALRATNGGSTGLPNVVDQVILQMNRGVKNGNDQMSIQLHPSDLGKITVKLDFSNDGKVQGTVTADNPKTLEILQKDSRSLERALQDAGLSADPGSLQFSLGGQSGNSNTNRAANDGGQGADVPEDGTISAQDTSGLVNIGAISENYYVTPTGVNIRV